MKKIINITLSALFIISMLASCTTKKQNCDAYGAISKIEKANDANNKAEISTKEETL